MTDAHRQLIAERGERLAAQWLEERGWEILERNWSRKLGEIDIVATRDVDWGTEQVPLLAFVEVKATAERGPIAPELHVNHGKRRKLITLAKLYLAENELRHVLGRFDVVGIDLDEREIRHYPAAFDASGRLL